MNKQIENTLAIVGWIIIAFAVIALIRFIIKLGVF